MGSFMNLKIGSLISLEVSWSFRLNGMLRAWSSVAALPSGWLQAVFVCVGYIMTGERHSVSNTLQIDDCLWSRHSWCILASLLHQQQLVFRLLSHFVRSCFWCHLI